MNRALRELLIWAMFSISIQAFGQAPSTQNGVQIFSTTCAACHGLDGRGGEHAPNIATDAAIQRKTDAQLTNIIRNGIPAAGMPAFGKLLDDDQMRSVVNHLRILQKDNDKSAVIGDAGRGHAIFFGIGRCSECHMMNGRGGFMGADLSGYGETHSAATIRQWILDPNKNSDMRRGTVTVVTQRGKRYRGVVRNEDNFSLQIQSLDGSFKLLNKSDLRRVERESESIMPADYRKKLTEAQVNDLVAFLARAKQATPSAADGDEEQ